ncbi:TRANSMEMBRANE PROTEIN [Salix viminalis]|uniref:TRANSMEMBRANE PROTEIN n=1 Tax=Salix viminalis TaxID=40686 RepID=A0A9Q0SDD5_SALVM|nr:TRANSMEMBRANE PROTEIN [Salix viminalis]
MSCNNKSNQPLFILLSFLFFFFLFTSSTATPSSTTSQFESFSIPDVVVGGRENDGVVVPWEIRRHLAEEGNTTSSLILAAKKTRRRDPLENFKFYTSGYNISNKHYWASVGFTAVPFFIVALVWFVIFGLCLSFICLCYCCCPTEPYGYSRACYALSLISLILFTIAAIAGCVVLYTGQGKFHSITTHTLEYVVNQANVTATNLRHVSDYLAAAKNTGVESVFLPPSVKNDIDSIQKKINSSGTTLSSTTQDNAEGIQDVLDSMRLSLIILAAVMLALAFLGFLSSIFGMQCLVYFLVILGWILVTGTFILCGVFLLLHK